MVKGEMRGSELIIGANGTLYHIGLKRGDTVPKNIILVGDPDRVHTVSSFLKDRREGARNREYVTEFGRYKDVPIMVMGTGIGTDNTEIASVELHAVHEFDHENGTWTKDRPTVNMIRVGTSGSPQKYVAVGSIAIATHGLGLDNTGIYYPFISSDPVTRHLVRQFRDSVLASIMKGKLEDICPSAIPLIEKKEITEGEVRQHLADLFRSYASSATPRVVNALVKSCNDLELTEGAETNGYHVGATSSASGFFGPQGRQVGRLNILVPNLQEILGGLSAAGVRVVNNEMESSALFRINGEVLGYNVGTVCAVVANRAGGVFASPQAYQESVDNAILTALGAMVILNS